MKKLLDQLDLITFGFVLMAAIWLIVGGTGSGRKHRDLALDHAEHATTMLTSTLAADRYEDESGARILDIVHQIPADVEHQWNPELVAKELPEGQFYHGPTLTDLREGRDLELRFPPPSETRLEAEVGLIRVIWGRDNSGTVPVTGYVVYRTGPDGVEQRAASLDPETTVWLDESVQAGRLYSYRVAATTDEPLLVRRNRAESRKTRPKDIRGKRDYEIKPVSYATESRQIRVLIRKYRAGIWHEKEFVLARGDAIGQVDPGSGVDYGTGCRVTAIDVAQETQKEERDEIQFDQNARVILQNGAPLTVRRAYDRPIQRIALRYDNELNEAETLELRVRL